MKVNKEDLLTQRKLKELLHYDPDTGLLTWRSRIGDCRHVKQFNTQYAGKTAGYKYHPDDAHVDYRVISVGVVLGKKKYSFLAHRLVWLYMTGKWPENQIDHDNGDATDNRWVNLDDVTRSKNGMNQKRVVQIHLASLVFVGINEIKNGLLK